MIKQGLGLFSGLPSCRSKRSCVTILSIRSMQAILPSGRPHGARSGTPSTTISCCWLCRLSLQFGPFPIYQPDILRWKPARNGICTTKDIYKHLSAQNTIQLSQQGSRSILRQANEILQRAWNSKDLPPIIKAFSWRLELIRRALATTERAARYSTRIDNHCSDCGAVEDDARLFFHCNLPRALGMNVISEDIHGLLDRLTMLLLATSNPMLKQSFCKPPLQLPHTQMQTQCYNTTPAYHKVRFTILQDQARLATSHNKLRPILHRHPLTWDCKEHMTQAIYIKARLQNCSSVIMAEAASLALASAISYNLNLSGVNFLSDCEQLVHFLNKNDISDPPDWRIKCFTQSIANYTRSRSSKILKIHRRLNTTADALLREALQLQNLQNTNLEFSCSSEHQMPHSNVLQALQSVGLTDVSILAARCGAANNKAVCCKKKLFT
ncbi:uncharacterized protein [Miscanthus floridulus]|uniref:uncharacterized protein n=1 Tax=Miscanthus floridulus TaxID=154761 RepID=UPI003457DE49